MPCLHRCFGHFALERRGLSPYRPPFLRAAPIVPPPNPGLGMVPWLPLTPVRADHTKDRYPAQVRPNTLYPPITRKLRLRVQWALWVWKWDMNWRAVAGRPPQRRRSSRKKSNTDAQEGHTPHCSCPFPGPLHSSLTINSCFFFFFNI